jgi:hypothetical protein
MIPESVLKLVERICNSLERKKISYMVSGGLAMNAYTVPRMTRDIDIVIELGLKDVDDFLEIFEHGFYCNKNTVNGIQN